ncbi:MMPL family transporter [Dactylosporangium sp. NPDC048998]|uniref:MMPL family transporter n=1 Tax=Dactylosporangium sp. NPDC048998 TaxID=3363976 RepID=UPI00370F95F5
MTRSVAGLIAGRWVKYGFVVFWLAVVALALPVSQKLSDAEKNDTKSWLPGGAESVQVLDIQASFTSPNTIPAVVVYERAAGLTDPDKAKLAADARAFGAMPELDGKVFDAQLTNDGQAAQIVVPLNLGGNGWHKAGDIAERLRATAEAGANGMTVHITGPLGNAADSSKAFAGIDTNLLASTVVVVVVILLVTYRSPLLWLLPVISSGVALVVAQGVIYLLARHAGLIVNAQSAGILTVLVFGAGTDYALLLIARYREELRRHSDRHEAMTEALHRAGPAIVASAGTVVLGMLCLLFAETNSTKGLGPVAAIGIAVGLAVMLTLLPVLLTICGRWIFWPLRPRLGSPEPTTTGLWARIGARIGRRPRAVWIVTAAVLALATIGIVQLGATGLTTKESFRGTQDSVVGEDVLARHGAAAAGTPVVVIGAAAKSGEIRAAVAGTSGLNPATVTAFPARNGHAYINAYLVDEPDSAAAYATVDRLRDRVHAIPGADAKVGGTTAINLDVRRAAKYDRDLIIPVVLAVVLLILILLLRSIVAPLVLIATVVLSFGAAMGISALVFRHVFGFAGADTSFPLFVFVFLVALGIDYNIFLMTRVREESPRHGTRRAALVGLAATGGVITSAGLVLAGTFAVLATLPLTAFAEIGFAVAFGVLLDTIIVRSVLVTALNLDAGRHMWWPSALSKVTDEPADTRELEPTVAAS